MWKNTNKRILGYQINVSFSATFRRPCTNNQANNEPEKKRLHITYTRLIKTVLLSGVTRVLPLDSLGGNFQTFRFARRHQQARVVRKVDNAIYKINHYPADSVVCFVNIYPLDSDFLVDSVILHSNNWGRNVCTHIYSWPGLFKKWIALCTRKKAYTVDQAVC